MTMPAYVVQYDLFKGDRSDYEALYSALKSSRAVRATESTWFVSTSWDAIRVKHYLRQFMHPKDSISVNVLAVDAGFASENLSSAAVAWMNKHLSSRQRV
jgi:hypothetical protein